MASGTRVAVVTGGNKGIGFAIVRGLCKQFDGDVILTARDGGLGKEAILELEKEGCHAKFHQLDILNKSSVETLGKFLQNAYGGLDILVNNAGIAYKNASTTPFAEQADVTCRTNFWGTLDTCRLLFPILRPHARVVNVSSMVSQFCIKQCSTDMRSRIKSTSLTMEELEKIIHEFVEAAKDGNHKEKGFPNSGYGMSKIGVTAMTFIQDREMREKDDIIINACCPGYVSTDMTSHKGKKTVEEGADTPLFLALIPANAKSPKGNYVTERAIEIWG